MARYKGAMTPAEYEALAAFRNHLRQFLHFSEGAARRAGVEAQQYQLMLAIKGVPTGAAPSIRDLAECLQIQHHSAVELIDRSAARGLVRRARGKSDRRQVLVELLPRGEKLLARLARHHRDELTSQAPALVAALERLVSSRAKTKRRT